MQFHIDDMTCGSCVKHITGAIAALDPDARIEADTVARRISVATTADANAVIRALADDGYTARLL
ncbi:Heavy-metal-associated domain protein [compost metagenome]